MQRCLCIIIVIMGLISSNRQCVEGLPRRILLDTDVDTDDLFALLYLLKLNTSEFHLEVTSLHIFLHIHVFMCVLLSCFLLMHYADSMFWNSFNFTWQSYSSMRLPFGLMQQYIYIYFFFSSDFLVIMLMDKVVFEFLKLWYDLFFNFWFKSMRILVKSKFTAFLN